MASKAFQSFETLINDTFRKNSKEWKAFHDFRVNGADVNKNPVTFGIVNDAANWTALGRKFREQGGRK